MSDDPNAELLRVVRSALPANYELEGFLDKGGQGAVFRGRLDDRPVALKLFAPQHDPGFRRLQREVPLLQSIDCPHLVKIVGQTDITIQSVPTMMVAYEFLTGGDLRQFLPADASPLSEHQLATVGHHVGIAVAELWKRRIVHRDIKPANIVVRDADSFVLVDVGLARHLDRSNLTMLGGSPGTPGFKSPEQTLGRRSLTVNSDVFSLGVTLYALASRKHPFDNSQHNIVSPTFAPLPLASLRPDLSEALVRLIHQMMARKAAQRPSNIREHFARFFQTGS